MLISLSLSLGQLDSEFTLRMFCVARLCLCLKSRVMENLSNIIFCSFPRICHGFQDSATRIELWR
jgi:hypothetical protein